MEFEDAVCISTNCSSGNHSMEEEDWADCEYWTQSGGYPPNISCTAGGWVEGACSTTGGTNGPGPGGSTGSGTNTGGNYTPIVVVPLPGPTLNYIAIINCINGIVGLGQTDNTTIDPDILAALNLSGAQTTAMINFLNSNGCSEQAQADVLEDIYAIITQKLTECLGMEHEASINNLSHERLGSVYSYLIAENGCSEEAQELVILAIENQASIYDLIYVLENQQDYRTQMSNDELSLFDSLSNEEKLLYLLSAKQAFDKTEQLWQTNCEKYNGKGDAFRHAYWNALSSQRIGVALTNQLTTRHENRAPLYAYSNKETDMDLFNNQIGRDIVSNGMTNLMLMQQAVHDAFDNGDLKYINNQASNCRATFSSILIPTNQ